MLAHVRPVFIKGEGLLGHSSPNNTNMNANTDTNMEIEEE